MGLASAAFKAPLVLLCQKKRHSIMKYLFLLISTLSSLSSTSWSTDWSVDPSLEIKRVFNSGQCTMGYLVLNGEVVCYTLELPYVGNITDLSTIPAGSYRGFVRTDGNKGWRIELENVAGRKNIQIHIGNYTAQTQGCTLIGTNALPDQCTVLNSLNARLALQKKINPWADRNIQITYSN